MVNSNDGSLSTSLGVSTVDEVVWFDSHAGKQ